MHCGKTWISPLVSTWPPAVLKWMYRGLCDGNWAAYIMAALCILVRILLGIIYGRRSKGGFSCRGQFGSTKFVFSLILPQIFSFLVSFWSSGWLRHCPCFYQYVCIFSTLYMLYLVLSWDKTEYRNKIGISRHIARGCNPQIGQKVHFWQQNELKMFFFFL